MIVRDESAVLAQCLDSIKDFVEEIVIVDTGSVDDTKEIAARYTDKIYDFEWVDDFAAARNFSYSKATQEYIMWLDADDYLPESEREEFLKLKNRILIEDVIMLRYITGFDEDGAPTFSFYRERITKRVNDYKWHEPVHEFLDKSGVIITSEIAIMHGKTGEGGSDRNLKIYEKQLNNGVSLSPRGVYYYARELVIHKRYEDAAERFKEFLDEKAAWSEDLIGACEGLSNCYAAMGDTGKALESLFRSFTYALPRAEICCSAGYIYQKLGDYKSALFWFKLAPTLPRPSSWGFMRNGCWDYIPLAECVVCYDKLGDQKSAEEYNELVAQIKPNAKSVEYNRRYFSSLKK
jgi:glycosyltransferase involved in cell wall biosynthesis